MDKTQPNEEPFDDIDFQIIRVLNRDARAPVSKIAEELSIPESTARHRLNRLIKDGAIEFTAVPNPLHLGYKIWAIVEIQAELAAIRPLAQELARSSEVYFVSITTGDYDIMVGAVFKSNEDLLNFLTNELARTRGIVRTRTATVLDVVKRFLTFDPPQDGPSGKTDQRL